MCKALKQAGHIPVAFDNLSTGHRDFVKWGPLCEGDIINPGDLDRAFASYEPDCVMHFAASSYVRESVLDPMKYYTNNCIGSLRLLEAMQRHGVTQIVFSSTCAVYGDCPTLPIDERAAQMPASPYGRSKQFVETAIKDVAAATGLKWVTLRYFNAAGADPDGDVGESHDPKPILFRALFKLPLALVRP